MKKLSKLQESVWGDLHSRGIGEIEREEDNVNLLDKDEFFKYVMSHYEVTRDSEMRMSYHRSMRVPILKIKGERRYAIILNHLAGYVEAHFHLEKFPEVYSALEKKFNVDSISHYGNSYLIEMKDKNVNQINQFFLDVIDTIIENAEFPILRKKNINESVWADLHSRGIGDTVREEEDHKFRIPFEEIKKIPDSELFEIKDKHTHLLWTPYNFGAKSESEPGLYLDGDEILELAEYLDGTEYHMATQSDWVDLNALSKYHYDYTKINGYWTYVFTSKDDENKKLYVPNFGYISSWFANHPEVPITPNGINKSDHTHYGYVFWGVPGRTELNNDHYFMKTRAYNYSLFYRKGSQTSDRPTDRLQVRLVKTPGKPWKFNKS